MGMARPSKEDELHRSEDSDTQRQLATYGAALAEAMERLALAHDGNGRRWHGQVEAALAALFEYLAAEPGLARVWAGRGAVAGCGGGRAPRAHHEAAG
jgi:hypothetical protein